MISALTFFYGANSLHCMCDCYLTALANRITASGGTPPDDWAAWIENYEIPPGGSLVQGMLDLIDQTKFFDDDSPPALYTAGQLTASTLTQLIDVLKKLKYYLGAEQTVQIFDDTVPYGDLESYTEAINGGGKYFLLTEVDVDDHADFGGVTYDKGTTTGLSIPAANNAQITEYVKFFYASSPVELSGRFQARTLSGSGAMTIEEVEAKFASENDALVALIEDDSIYRTGGFNGPEGTRQGCFAARNFRYNPYSPDPSKWDSPEPNVWGNFSDYGITGLEPLTEYTVKVHFRYMNPERQYPLPYAVISDTYDDLYLTKNTDATGKFDILFSDVQAKILAGVEGFDFYGPDGAVTHIFYNWIYVQTTSVTNAERDAVRELSVKIKPSIEIDDCIYDL